MDKLTDSIIEAVFSNYIEIYEIDLENDYIKLVYLQDKALSLDLDKEGVYSEFNRKYSRERVEKEYARERERRGALENLRKELGEKESFEFSYTVNSDKVRTVEYKRLLMDDTGKPIKALMGYKRILDDRAEVFKLKLERKKHRDLLEEKLNEAKAASLEKLRFLSNMSHDIRTPISSMMGYINLSKTHIDNKDLVLTYLDKMESNSEQLISLINDVLDISRIESGKASIEEYQQSLYSIIEEVKDLIEPIAQSREQNFNVNIEVENEEILADKLRLVKILSNILTNAVKYTHRCGTIDFTIKEDLERKEEGYVAYLFEIKDNGVGISEEFLPHIFNPFERENDREIAAIQGTGLGLSIARELTKMLSGELEVESEKYKGTKVTIAMKFKLFRQDILANKPNLIHESNFRRAEDLANQRTFERKRFLIVDDNEANLEILSTFLQDLGASTDTATNGFDALNKFKKSRIYQYNAVLMDIKMPIMNGNDTTREIRKLSNRTLAAVPIVGISANVYPQDRLDSLDAGMDAYLVKPVNTTELIRVLKEVML